MNNIEIAVIDYGMGNLRSVSKALEFVGAKAIVTNDRKRILSSKAAVFPGVGSFGPAIKYLKESKLDNAIKEVISENKYFLGLCLGFQLLFETSFEEGRHKGLAEIAGDVKRFTEKKGKRLIVPHMGWNNVAKLGSGGDKMFKNIPDNSFFYFVHSYYGIPEDNKVISGKTLYGGNFCSAVVKGNIWACQFHPEKSGRNGLQLLRNFVKEVEKC